MEKSRSPAHSPTVVAAIGRSVRKRCPACGRGKLFRGWFKMHERCGECGLKFHREPGYWLGSIYVNYGLTALLTTIAYFVLFFTEALPQTTVLWLLTAFCVLFPLWLFPFARAAWINFDWYFDPERPA